jgi:hypothetical protein
MRAGAGHLSDANNRRTKWSLVALVVTRTIRATSMQLKRWQCVLLAVMAGGMGWGVRGQYGHETGAMIAGLLVGLVLVFCFCPQAASLPAARAVAWCTVAIGFGGSMTYGQTIGLTQNGPMIGNWAALRWGMLGLAIKGGLWIGFAGAFLGMGLSGRSYRPRELLCVMLGLLALFFLGVWLLNSPYDPAHRLLPRIYFSADWRWEPSADLKPRREVWGGFLVALIGLVAYLAWARRDVLARNLAGWGVLGGALGFPTGQSLQAFHAWNAEVFRAGWWATLDPHLNWWNLMETTFGAVFGGVLALGVWVNRARIATMAETGVVALRPWVEWLLVAVHVPLLVMSELSEVPWLGVYTEFSLLLGLIPMVAVAGGRWWPYLLCLPITLLPIAGKTVRQLCYLEPKIDPAWGWFWYGIVPLLTTVLAAIWFVRGAPGADGGRRFTRGALLLCAWLYFALNFAFFQFPWPWMAWTPRTPNGLIFLICAGGLTLGVLSGSRALQPAMGVSVPTERD